MSRVREAGSGRSAPNERRDGVRRGRDAESGESEPRVRRASESLNVFVCSVFSDEHSAKWYARSGPGQPLAPEQRDKPGALSSQQITAKDKGGYVKRTGACEGERTFPTDQFSDQNGNPIHILSI